ncbi:polysaccharide biosynthesis/export family protein [uncultured Maritalea sp.]|uniref:polysaccharide biosynthesis/export family protein n=1 Tax=uncultured Maritalea sp. TaxID=757249 RepID=UPI002604BF6D|nr:polysaccharide biosynthesis/export family protein [uncultured Maritalea sp.]
MRLVRFAALFVLLFVSACATGPRPSTHNGQAFEKSHVAYQLDTGDVLRVTVYNDAQLTNSFGIDDAGFISMPLVGRVYVRGKTVNQASALITSSLASGYLRDPNVAVEVAQYRPFYIQGEVASSGQFPFVFGMSVRAAISTAGGFSDVATKNSVTIYRKATTGTTKLRAKMDDLVQPGDTIVVHERWL